VEFRILGPLEVVNGHDGVTVDAPKLRALLGVLLLHPNEVVSSERLIDELWGERPPATAPKLVQTYVSQLRRELGPETIETRAPGYLLRVDKHAVDAARFRELVAEGRWLAASDELERARSAYGEALALWRGPPFADVLFESFARNEVAQLEQERLSALMDLTDCELALGRHAEVVPELETLVRQYPVRERLWGQLMLALYRSGRQADALAAYQDARRTLAEELGLEPGRELQDLEKAVLTQDPALDEPARAASGTGQIATGPPRPGWLTGWRTAAVVIVIGLAVALVLALALGGHDETSLQLAPNSVGFIDANSGRLTRSFGVGREPRALEVAFGSLWVAEYQDETVSRFDRTTGRRLASMPVGGHPTAIVAYRGRLWVWTLEGLLVAIDPRYDRAHAIVRAQRQAPSRVQGAITAGGGFLWLTAPATTVIRVDLTNPSHPLTISPDAGVQGPIDYGGGRAWVAGADQIFPITTHTGIPGTGIDVGDARSLAFYRGDLWAVSGGPGHLGGVTQALRRVDLRGRLLLTTITVGADPVAAAAAGGSVWVASRSDGTIARVDPAQNRVSETLQFGASPTALAADEDGVWVTAG